MLVVVFTITKVALLLPLTQRERHAHAHALPSNVAVPALGLYLAQSDQHR